TPVDIDVLDNDDDPDGTLDPASVAITGLPNHGTVTVDPATGVITYTPDPDWSGTDTFSYQVCDDQGACDTADVTVTVDPVNDQQPPQPTPTPAPHPTPTGLPASDASGAWTILTGGTAGPGGPGMAGGLLAVLALVVGGLAWVALRRRGTGSDRRG
ncbi:MAG TPA: Ig-like domain-containing protein, partial [Candidatus Limnocylindrales bacterium]